MYPFNWSYVVRLAVVVPSVDFDKVDDGAVGDEGFPAVGEEPVVWTPDEVLGTIMLYICQE